MATPNSLAPVQPKKETKFDLRDVIGGTFEYVADSIMGTNEGPVRSQEILEPERGWTEIRPTAGSFPSRGEITNFHEVKPQVRMQQLREELANAQHLEKVSEPVEEKRAQINDLNRLQVAYQGSVDREGNVTIYHEANAAVKNSELAAMDLKVQKENMVVKAKNKATSPKGALGPRVDMNTTFEDQNMNRPG